MQYSFILDLQFTVKKKKNILEIYKNNYIYYKILHKTFIYF